MNFVKTISTEIDSLSRRVIKFLRFGNKDVQTSLEAMPFGTDSNPIKDMVAIYAMTEEKGKTVIIGYLNTSQIAAIGEHRIYSTDANGNIVMSLHLKNDGTAEFGGSGDNMMRFSAMETAFNELKTDFNNLVTIFNTHVHPGVTSGPGSTLITTTTGSSSSADMSGSKIDEIKTL